MASLPGLLALLASAVGAAMGAHRLLLPSPSQHILRQAFSKACRRHGLRLDKHGLRASGHWQGVYVVAQLMMSDRQSDLVLRVRPGVYLPGGLHFHPEGVLDQLSKAVGGQDLKLGHAEADGVLRIRADDPSLALELLARGGVRRALIELVEAGACLRFDRFNGLEAEQEVHSPPELRLAFDRSLAVVQGMVGQVEDAWEAQAQRFGLVRLTTGSGGQQLHGTIQGVVVVAELQVGGHRTSLRVQAQVPAALPLSLRVERREPGAPARGHGLGNPVLDQLLDVYSKEPAPVRAILGRPELTEELAAALLERPGSRILGDRVELVHPGSVGAVLPQMLAEAVGLAKALAEAAGEG